MSPINTANIFMTGGAGTLGRAVARRRKEEGWTGRLTVYSTSPLKHAQLRADYPDIQFVQGDIRNYETLRLSMLGHDIVIHAAAVKYIPDSEWASMDTIDVNTYGSQMVCQAARETGMDYCLGISTDKACLEWHSPVLLENDKTIEIGELVNKKITCKVKSYAVLPFEHVIENKNIKGWFKNKVNGRKMYSISYINAPSRSGIDAHVLVTEDHLVLCNKDGYMQWIEASKLIESGAKLITAEWKYNWLQEALLCGTVMGDGNISINKGEKSRPRLRISHAMDQKEWALITGKALNIETYNVQKSKRNKQDTISINSSTSASMFEYFHDFYKNGKKIIPTELFLRCFKHGFTKPILLSSWYMDDGCTTDNLARIATHNFTCDEVDWIANVLTEDGFTCYPYRVTVSEKEYCELRFTKEGSDKLYNLITEYVPLSMRRKIPPEFHDIDYSENLWNLGTTTFYHAEPVVKCVGDNKTGDVYCVEVEETNNFIVNNIVLHNCHPANTYGASKMLMEKIFQEYARSPGDTLFNLVRYGNVLESVGSVIEAWKNAVAEGRPVKITNPEMTRFWLSPSQAVDYVIEALGRAGGRIYIPRMPALSIGKLLEYTIGLENCVPETIPMRPGEKLHETLLTCEETDYAELYPAKEPYYILHPTTEQRLGADIQPFTSADAHQLTREELEELLKNE